MINHTPTINFLIGGAPVQVDCDTFAGPDGTTLDPDAVLSLPNPTGFANVATIALHPTLAHSVIVTPAASGGGGSASLLVSEVGGATDVLSVEVSVTPVPNIKRVVYKSQGPVQ